ncbi:MAG: pilin [Patescibacteria group bacterium]
MKTISKHLISLAIISLLVLPFLALPAMAQFDPGLNEVNNGLNNSLSTSDPRTVIGRVINVALGFLGVIAVGIILLGGFKWMTAAGNEEKTAEARKLLGAGVIGLIIILASWGIATFVINSLNTAVSGQ